MRRRTTVAALAAATSTVLAGIALSAPAGSEPLTDSPPSLDDFELSRTSLDLQGRVEKLDSELAKQGVQNLLAEANRETEQHGGCEGTAALVGIPAAEWYCFEPSDNSTEEAAENGTLEWWPQGVTTVADAQDDQRWGDKQAILVSWYDKANDEQKGVRVSFLDPATGKYRHVLLVYPYLQEDGDPTYEILSTPQSGDHPGIHAGGIVWYGNDLYVADTQRGIRVFDMRYIMDLKESANGNTSDENKIGRVSTVSGTDYYGYGYRYVMPQVDAWVNAAGPDNSGSSLCAVDGAPKFSFIGLDRSSTPDQLITGEYCKQQTDSEGRDIPNTDGRLAHWALNGDNGMIRAEADGHAHASAVFRSDISNIQGAVTWNDKWYLSRTGRGADGKGYLTTSTGTPNAVEGLLSMENDQDAGIGVEDLSYWPGQDTIWTVTEHPGKRVLYSVPRP